jgi:hypothetical protein
MIGQLLGLALAAAAAGQAEPEADRYTPSTGWSDNEWAASFFERWYGGQLRAMGEPRLSVPSQLDGFRRRFRLLVVPNYRSAFAYRIDERPDGGAVLRWVRLDGAGGYAPGNVAAAGVRMLHSRELSRFAAALEAAALPTLARDGPPETARENNDGTQTLTICLHATHYVFEQLEPGGRRYVSRRSCYLEEPLERLAQVLFEIKRPPPGSDIREEARRR